MSQKVSTSCFLFLAGLFLIANYISTVESRNDLTTIKRVVCNAKRLKAHDPFIKNVHYLLSTITSEVTNEGSREYYHSNTDYGTTAYIHGRCDPSTSEEECAMCLNALCDEFKPRCGFAIGAQIEMTACYVRYENHGFL